MSATEQLAELVKAEVGRESRHLLLQAMGAAVQALARGLGVGADGLLQEARQELAARPNGVSLFGAPGGRQVKGRRGARARAKPAGRHKRGKNLSPAQVEAIAAQLKKGVPPVAIATAYKRSPGAIYALRSKLGLKPAPAT